MSDAAKERTSDLVARCAEIIKWQKTGLLHIGQGGALRALADSLVASGKVSDFYALRLAEDITKTEAMQFVVDHTPAQGEPSAWLCQDETGFMDVTRHKELVEARSRFPDYWRVVPLYTHEHSPAESVTELELAEAIREGELSDGQCDAGTSALSYLPAAKSVLSKFKVTQK